MIRWLLWLVGGAVLGGIVHLATVLVLPRTATQDAYARIAGISPVNQFVPLPDPAGDRAPLPFMDPAFASAVCRYDLSEGSMKFSAPVSPAYTSVSFYTRNGIAYYAINDRAAGRRVIELDLMTSAQRAALPDDEEITAADRLDRGIADHYRPHSAAHLRAGARPDGRRQGLAQWRQVREGPVTVCRAVHEIFRSFQSPGLRAVASRRLKRLKAAFHHRS